MATEEKIKTVEEIKNSLSESSSVIVVHYQGLTVDDITDLRRSAREKDVTIKVVKNSLFKIAANDTDYKALFDQYGNDKGRLVGPVAAVFSKDPVSGAKVVIDYAKKNDKLKVLYGALGREVLDSNSVKSLAALPSLDELRSKILGLLSAPASKLARVIQEVPSGVARVINEYSKKQ